MELGQVVYGSSELRRDVQMSRLEQQENFSLGPIYSWFHYSGWRKEQEITPFAELYTIYFLLDQGFLT